MYVCIYLSFFHPSTQLFLFHLSICISVYNGVKIHNTEKYIMYWVELKHKLWLFEHKKFLICQIDLTGFSVLTYGENIRN